MTATPTDAHDHQHQTFNRSSNHVKFHDDNQNSSQGKTSTIQDDLSSTSRHGLY